MGRRGQRQDRIGVRWGMPCSAFLHCAIVALMLLVLPEPRKPKALPKEIPVEVVRKAPEKKPAEKPKKLARKTPPKPKEKKPVAKKEPPKPPEKKLILKEKLPQPPERKAAEKNLPPKEKPAAPPKQEPAEKKPQVAEQKSAKPAGNPALKPEARKPEAGNPAKEPRLVEKKPQPAPKPPMAAKEPQLALGPKPPVLRPKPAAPPKPKAGSLKVPPHLEAVPHPDAKKRKLLGQWVLRPLILDTGHRCGIQRVTGIMTLINRRVRAGGTEVQYLAEIRTTIRWERCRPEGALTKLVLIQRGDRVFLVGAKGVMDHGLMRGNVMILRDSLGDSFWHLRK